LTSRDLTLSVNGADIQLDYFVQGFIDHVVSGMLAALENTGQIKSLELTISGEKVSVNLNGEEVPLNFFVNKVIRNTLTGIVTSLKGIDRVEKLELHIAK
jgi:hypothetical protein